MSARPVDGDSPAAASSAPAAPAPSYRVLVVEDSLLCRKMLVRLLGSSGHVCQQAEDGQQALAAVRAALAAGERYDAILMDNVMPVMDGMWRLRCLLWLRPRCACDCPACLLLSLQLGCRIGSWRPC